MRASWAHPLDARGFRKVAVVLAKRDRRRVGVPQPAAGVSICAPGVDALAQPTETSSTKIVPVPYQPWTHTRTLLDEPVLKVTDSLV